MDKFKKIMSAEIRLPKRLSPEAADLVTKLLTRDTALRLGAHGAGEIKRHPFFSSVDWTALAERRVTPPFKPPVKADTPPRSPREGTSAETPSLSDGSSDQSGDEEGGKAASKPAPKSMKPVQSRRSSCGPDSNAVTDDEDDDKGADHVRPPCTGIAIC